MRNKFWQFTVPSVITNYCINIPFVLFLSRYVNWILLFVNFKLQCNVEDSSIICILIQELVLKYLVRFVNI